MRQPKLRPEYHRPATSSQHAQAVPKDRLSVDRLSTLSFNGTKLGSVNACLGREPVESGRAVLTLGGSYPRIDYAHDLVVDLATMRTT